MIIGGLFQNLFLFFIINGFFSIFLIWILYFTSNKKHVQSEHVEEIKNINIEHVEKDIIKPEIPDGDIYVGEIITEQEFKQMEKERRTWYKESCNHINNSLFNLYNSLNREETDNG